MFHSLLEEAGLFLSGNAVGADLFMSHSCIAGFKAFVLDLASIFDAGGDGERGFSGLLRLEFVDGKGVGFDMDVYTVKKGTADFVTVSLDMGGGAAALAFGIA